ncbi:unnamed protein product [Chrysoparadoxa australica]
MSTIRPPLGAPAPSIPVSNAIVIVALYSLLRKRKDLSKLAALVQNKDGDTSKFEKMLVGTGLIFVFERLTNRALAKLGLSLPSSMVSMLAAYVALEGCQATAGEETSRAISKFFGPAVEHLGVWMPLYLTPPLVVLPNAIQQVKGGGSMWAKLAGVHISGWILTLISTGALARYIQRRSSKGSEVEPTSSDAQVDTAVEVDSASADGIAQVEDEGEDTKQDTEKDDLRAAWEVLTALSFAVSPYTGPGPASFSSTVMALMHGNALPAGWKKVLHPLVVSSLGAGIAAVVQGRSKGMDVASSLTGYFPKKGMNSGAAGDLLFGLLGASCCALGFRMYDKNVVLKKNLRPLVLSTLFSSALSLFGTTAACGAAGLPKNVSMSLNQRSVMSSLGIPASQLLGGDPTLAVASILVTGVYGASLGQSILDKLGITRDDPVTRGVATGASAHSIGTAALMGEEDEAAAVSSVTIALAGVWHTVACSLEPIQAILHRLS